MRSGLNEPKCGSSAAGVIPRAETLGFTFTHPIGMLPVSATRNSARPLPCDLTDRGTDLIDRLSERRLPIGEAEQIVCDDDLPVTLRPGATSDHGNSNALDDVRGDFRWNGLDENHGSTRCFESLGFLDQSLGGIDRAAIGVVPSVAACLLRLGTDVGDHRNSGMSHPSDEFGVTEIDFQLHRIRMTFNEKTSGISQTLLNVDLVAHERHVADHPAIRGASLHRGGECDEKFERRMDRSGQTENHLGCGISHQENRNPRRLHVPCRQGVVGGQTGKRFTGIDLSLKRANRDRAFDRLKVDLNRIRGPISSRGKIHVG